MSTSAASGPRKRAEVQRLAGPMLSACPPPAASATSMRRARAPEEGSSSPTENAAPCPVGRDHRSRGTPRVGKKPETLNNRSEQTRPPARWVAGKPAIRSRRKGDGERAHRVAAGIPLSLVVVSVTVRWTGVCRFERQPVLCACLARNPNAAPDTGVVIGRGGASGRYLPGRTRARRRHDRPTYSVGRTGKDRPRDR